MCTVFSPNSKHTSSYCFGQTLDFDAKSNTVVKTILQFFSTAYTNSFKLFLLKKKNFTHKSNNCTHKMQNALFLLQNEALYSKYHKHVSKANICFTLQIHIYPKHFLIYHKHKVNQNLQLFFHELLCTFL